MSLGDKICPLMSGRLAGSPMANGSVLPVNAIMQPITLPCVKSNCQLWDDDAQLCSLVEIDNYSCELGKIYAALQALEPPKSGSPLSRIADALEVLLEKKRKSP